jgi:hypothetical protein
MRSAVGHVGAPVRPTAHVRPTVPVRLIPTDHGVEASDPYVRKFWVAALGPGAVAELLRLVSAAGKGEEVRLPRHLPQLLRTGLVTVVDGTLAVKERIPSGSARDALAVPTRCGGTARRLADQRSAAAGLNQIIN